MPAIAVKWPSGRMSRGDSLVLGKHSGKAAYRQRLIELGYADIAADNEQLAKSTLRSSRASLLGSPA